MKKMIISAMAAAAMAAVQAFAVSSATSAAVTIDTRTSIGDSMLIQYSTLDAGACTVSLDGQAFIDATNSGTWRWQPQSTGNHTLTLTAGSTTWTHAVKVTGYDFFVQAAPNPPMGKVTTLAITPVSRSFEMGGGAGAIVTSGSGTWTAAVSDSWITLDSTSGTAGNPVVYAVTANPNIEARTGYVYVSGYTHTITQAGHGATVSPSNAEFEHNGGTGQVTVTAAGGLGWHARPNCDWISVSPVSGTGEAAVKYQVAPWEEVSTRTGTMTIAGETVTVFQYGRRIKLSEYTKTVDYHVHAIALTVNALAITHWSVTPNASWISVTDAGNGVGGDTVGLAVGENPSYKARTGTVTIGTETFKITQQGRTALEFNISPTNSTASRDGANGLVAVTATPDLPWSASFNANWCTILPAFTNGAGNGTIAYTVSPNSTLSSRTAKLTVTSAATSLLSRVHTVTQPAAVSALSSTGYEFAAAGEATSVNVAVADCVEWQISNTNSWLTVAGSTSRLGPGAVTLTAAANDTVYPRSGKVTIAKKTFNVSQKARGVEIEYDTKLFGTDGGFGEVDIHPDGNISWTAVSSDTTWITVYGGGSGTGNGTVLYVVSPYVGEGESRTGTITVGDKVIYITQRPYDLRIDPYGEQVTGNAGAGEVGVSAGINDVWNAIVTEPWITIITGYDHGTGSGTVYFSYTENDTGKTRTGRIVIAGEIYTLTQLARVNVAVTTVAGPGGSVTGGGTYALGTDVTLTAVPDSGYEFRGWTLPDSTESLVNPLFVRADVPKTYTAAFGPLTPDLISADSSTNGVALVWSNLAWAVEYKVYRGEAAVPSTAEVIATLAGPVASTYLDTTGEEEVLYWYWVEAVGLTDSTLSPDPLCGHRVAPPRWTSGGVPYEWLEGFGLASGGGANEAAYESAAAATAANGRNTVQECYVLGLDPTDANSAFRALIEVVDGEPTVSWEPKLSPEEEAKRDYIVEGLESLVGTNDWGPQAPGQRFFRVGVELKMETPAEDEGSSSSTSEMSPAAYYVIDLSAGANATNYPVRCLEKAPDGGFNTDAYKTTNLVLKLCPAGSFVMGDNQTDESHRVTLTKPFYMGLFEVTQRQ